MNNIIPYGIYYKVLIPNGNMMNLVGTNLVQSFYLYYKVLQKYKYTNT
jgi:hypothetical protein